MKKWFMAYLEIFKIIGIAIVSAIVLSVPTCGIYLLLYLIFNNEWIALLALLAIAITLVAQEFKDVL